VIVGTNVYSNATIYDDGNVMFIAASQAKEDLGKFLVRMMIDFAFFHDQANQ